MFTGPILKKVATNKFAVASAAASLAAYLNNPDSYLPWTVSNMYKTYQTGSVLGHLLFRQTIRLSSC